MAAEAPIPPLTDADLVRIRNRYRGARDKRFRPEGRHQYVAPKDIQARLLNDPFTPSLQRAPIDDEVDAIVIGAGFGGLMAGAMLRGLGVKRIRLVDQAGDVGGTWYWNRYPGARCDIESYIYAPLLEETGYMPTEAFITATELLEHARRIAYQYDLYANACFQTDVTRLEWDVASSRWVVHTSRGDRMRARFVFAAPGPLQRAHLPAIPGQTDFQGHSFLTCRWDYAYTKGDVLGGLTGFGDKRVALIGTGATGVQVMPVMAEYCRHLYVVQRTPTPVGPRPNPKTDPAWVASLTPGWQERRMRNFAAVTSGTPQGENLVADEWTRYFGGVHAAIEAAPDPEAKARAHERFDFERDEYIRRHVDAVVADPKTAQALKHQFRYFCKRPTFSATYLQAFNRSNVTLIDTDGRGLDRITATGLLFDGKEYPVDCIVYASGFEADADYHTRCGFEIVGRDGLTLAEKWKNGSRTLHALNTHGFPNLFLLGGTQGGFYLNFVNRLNEDMKQARHILGHLLASGKSLVEPTVEAEDAWTAEIRRLNFVDTAYLDSCTPGQYNNWGDPLTDAYLQSGLYGLGPIALEDLLKAWRDAGTLQGLIFS